MMTVHDFGDRAVVMDGRRCVAVARKRAHGPEWVMRIHGGCWADTPRNEAQAAWYRKLGLRWDAAPHLKAWTGKRRVMKELRELAGGLRGS